MPAEVRAQQPASSRATILIGAGGAVPLSGPGVERRTGAAALVAGEVSLVRHLHLRAEVGGDRQELDTRADGPLSGDVQHARVALAARYAPVAVWKLRPYALLGGGLFWRSGRIDLQDRQGPVPGAVFRETTSETSAGILVGGGATVALRGIGMFAEARLTSAGGENGAASDVAVLAGVSLPLVR